MSTEAKTPTAQEIKDRYDVRKSRIGKYYGAEEECPCSQCGTYLLVNDEVFEIYDGLSDCDEPVEGALCSRGCVNDELDQYVKDFLADLAC